MPRLLPDFPKMLDERGFYYGWVVLAAGTIGVVMSVPGQTMGVSVYTEHLLKSLDLSRVNLSMAYMFGTLASAFLLPLVGRLLDKVGARVVGVMASSCLALFLAILAASPFMATWVSDTTGMPHRWASLGVAFFCFLGIRHFGQGQLTMASRTMMGRWFERRRGLVLGVSGFFVAFGFGAAPLALTGLIVSFHWQASLLVLSAILLGMAAFAALTFRPSPEHCGLVIDGGAAPEDAVSDDATDDFTAQQAKRTLVFWVFNAGMVAQAMIVTAVTFNMAHIGALHHMTPEKAFSVFLPVAVISTAADLTGGFLSDRMPMKYLLAVMQAGLALGLFGLQLYGTAAGFCLTALGLGVSGGLFSLLMGAAWPRLFGRTHLGAIIGVTMSWVVAGSALGPWLFSIGETAGGNDMNVLRDGMAVPLFIFIAAFFADNPREAAPQPA
ncbi:MAG: MFS transporter [Alphaproteobacteria bacterium]|nr:MFS transporter [Alphaproteobacteria bacterium]